MRRLGSLLLLVLAGIGLFWSPAFPQGNDEEEKGRFTRFVEKQLSTADRQISIGRIEGVLSSDVRISTLTIADREGVWLTINGVHLVWSRLALLSGRLDIDLLEAESLAMTRKPLPATTLQPAARGALTLPELPVEIAIDKLNIPHIALAEPFLGTPANLSLGGALSLKDGALDSSLVLSRIDEKPGRLAFAARYSNATRQLDLNLRLEEPENGIAANLLGIPGRPALAFAIAGTGPLDHFLADVGLSAGGEPLLQGQATIVAVAEGYHFLTNLEGRLAPLVPPLYAAYVRGPSSLKIEAIRHNDGRLELRDVTVKSGALALEAAGSFAPDLFPTALRMKGLLADPTGAPIPLPGAAETSTLRAARFALDFGGAAEGWTARFDLDGLDTGTLRSDRASIRAEGLARNLGSPGARALTFTLKGGVGDLSAKDERLARALGEQLDILARGDWRSNAPLSVAIAEVRNPHAAAHFTGTVNGLTLEGRYWLNVADISLFSGLFNRALAGAVAVETKGRLGLASGAFALRFAAEGRDLKIGVPAVDRLLSGQTRLAGRAIRSREGLIFENLGIENPRLTARLDGRYNLDRADLSLIAQLSDMRDLTDRGTGSLTLATRLSGRGDRPDVTAALTSDRLILQGKPLEKAELRFDGALSGTAVTGVAQLKGRLGPVPIEASAKLSGQVDGSGEVRDLVFRAADTRISADLLRTPAGLLEGRMALTSPDVAAVAPLALTRAAGRLDVDLTLAAADGAQSAKITASAAQLTVEGLSFQSAFADIEAGDIFGNPQISGQLAASGLRSGTIAMDKLKATALRDGKTTDFTLKGSGLALDPAPGLPSLTLVASGRLFGARLTLDAQMTGGGVAVKASGSLPLTGAALDIRINGTLPLRLAEPALATRGARVTGLAVVDIRVAGALTAPRLAGSLRTRGARFTDPTTGLRLTAIDLALALTGEQAVVERFTARVGRRGRLSASGSIGLLPGSVYPVDLTLILSDARLSDGNIVTADVSGRLSITGPALGTLEVRGHLDVARAEITIPESLPRTIKLLDVKHRLPPPNVVHSLERARRGTGKQSPKGKISRLNLALTLNAPNRVFVRGRGIDAELGGRITLQGPVSDLRPIGSFDMRRGRVMILDKRINFDRGQVTLLGNLDPAIDFLASARSNAITVTASITGDASSPEISLSSVPELPEDEILAQFLFGRSITDLSPIQIANLAMAATDLGGRGSGGLLSGIRQATGLEDLEIITDEEGGAAVQAGRYISENVYLGVTGGAVGQSNVSVNLDITKNLKARVEAGPASGSKFGILYEKEY